MKHIEPPALELKNPDESGNDYILAEGVTGVWIECFGTTLHIFQPHECNGAYVRVEQSKNDDCDAIIAVADFRL